ncbi:XkdF-like putative serine protease domain-containing protein [Haloarcula pelagica]|uniref:XkdF-like putative serine protease domain-containing protein n=1 Tax=Haloarcula pelagica TaxID=3033389 RepID=UPI0024C3BD71|nr:XkdF-like putative serine protease domain-containing protein [Halomicroarcula sp. YJ-61-S]
MPVQRDEQHYEKRVDYVAKDEDAQTATGVVMVPWTVDHHGDWERPETIEAFAAQFDAFIDAEQADGGILHSVWPSDWMTLERNEVLAEAEEIGGETVPEGAWVQSWGYHDDELWGLVEDDILGGHSIGAVSVDWSFSGEDPEDLPDEVDVPDEVDAVEYYELTDGIIQEVSAVDFPAVPDAQILTASKARAAAAEKRFAEHVGNPNGFIEEALERGHSEEAAQRMWDVVDRAINVDGAGEPGAKSKGRLTRAATTVLSALTGSDDGSTSEPPDASTAKDATGGETPDDGGTAAADDMSNKDDEPPEWAQTIIEQTKENSERLDEIQNADDDGDPLDDAPEWARAVVEQTQKNAERIDAISKQTGTTESQQLGGTEKGGGGDGGISERQAFFIPDSKLSKMQAAQGGRR